MTRPLKIQGTTPKSLKEISDSELDFCSHILLSEFSSNTTGIGALSVNPGSSVGLTLIGTFTDTSRPDAVGTHPVGTTVNSTVYNFYQNLQTDSSTPTRPLKFSSGQGLKESSDSDIQTHIASRTLYNLTSFGPGAYKLQSSAPVSGGTWTSVATITDTFNSGANTNVTYLWRRTDTPSAPTEVRPLKARLLGNEYNTIEMSNTDIQSLKSTFKNYIGSSGIGQYRLQENVPSTGGTWILAGSSFSDTRQELANVSYSGTYSGSYSGTYSTAYAGAYAGSYYTGYYAGTYVRFFGGNFFGGSPGSSSSYTGYYTGYYRGFYTGFYTGNYTGFYTGNYTGNYTGQTVISNTETASTVSLWLRTA